MLCDEDFMSSLLDKPVDSDYPYIKSYDAVQHVADSNKGLWSKVVNMDLCDRASLASLFANIWLLQRICPVSFFHDRVLPSEHSPIPDETGNKDLSSYLSVPMTVYSFKTSLIMSYTLYPHGSAFDLLVQRGTGLPELLVCAIVSRAFVCLERMHANGLLHRNLCSKHLLLTSCSDSRNKSDDKQISIRLCGLGSLVDLSSTAYTSTRVDLPPIDLAWRGWRCLPYNVEQNHHHPVQWYAPEVLAQDFTGYSWPSDIYSLGLVIYELFTGCQPFNGELSPTQTMMQKLLQSRPPKLVRPGSNVRASAAMEQVYNACTRRLPHKRSSIHQILAMSWIQSGLSRPFTNELLEDTVA